MDPALPARAADLLLQAQHVYIYAPDAPADWLPFFVIAQDDWGSSLFS